MTEPAAAARTISPEETKRPWWQTRTHSQPIARANSTTRPSSQGGPRNTPPSARAEMIRCASTLDLAAGAVSPFAIVKFADGILQVILGEVGPQAIEKDQL